MQHIETIPGRLGSGRLGSGRLTCDYNAISVQLQLQLPTGTELGNRRNIILEISKVRDWVPFSVNKELICMPFSFGRHDVGLTKFML